MMYKNRRAYHDYLIEETYVAGLSLLGAEVKALRLGKIQWGQSWIEITPALSAFVHHLPIGPYDRSFSMDIDPHRSRQLLLKKSELRKLQKKCQMKGYTLIPLKVFLKGPLFKLELGLGKGKTPYDKRQSIKEKDRKRLENQEFSKSLRDL